MSTSNSKERPILFSGPMVRALLDGTKTQTRRTVKGAPLTWLEESGFSPDFVASQENALCPYGQVGDRLWVRETWARDEEDGALMYRADLGRDLNADAWERGRIEGAPGYRWRPSIHMPRAASRITLGITSVRVERLRDISDADAINEGIASVMPSWWRIYGRDTDGHDMDRSPITSFCSLWEAINGQGSWDANPWVWVVSFDVLSPTPKEQA